MAINGHVYNARVDTAINLFSYFSRTSVTPLARRNYAVIPFARNQRLLYATFVFVYVVCFFFSAYDFPIIRSRSSLSPPPTVASPAHNTYFLPDAKRKRVTWCVVSFVLAKSFASPPPHATGLVDNHLFFITCQTTAIFYPRGCPIRFEMFVCFGSFVR